MTQKSFLWDGTSTGDAATYAPFNAAEFNEWSSRQANPDGWGYVVPDYLNDLEVFAGDGGGIGIKSGAAFINNTLHINDSTVYLNVAPTGASIRHDVVVLRAYYDSQIQKTEVAIIEDVVFYYDFGYDLDPIYVGSLQQDNSIWECPIAVLNIPANSSTITAAMIKDERKFYPVYNQTNEVRNLIRNSEFIAYGSPGTTYPPAEWEFVGTPSVVTVGAATSKTAARQRRGQYVEITGAGIAQLIDVREINNQVFTLAGTLFDGGSVKVEAMDTSYNVLDTYQEIYVGADNTYVQMTMRFETDTAIAFLNVQIGDETYSSLTEIYQFTLAPGYYPAAFTPQHEVVGLRRAITDASWSDTAKSTAVTAIDLSTDFNAYVPNGVRGVLLRVRGRDSGSAAGTASITITPFTPGTYTAHGRVLDLSGITNDVYREMQVIVSVDEDLLNNDMEPQFSIDITATGASTLDATVEIVGIIG